MEERSINIVVAAVNSVEQEALGKVIDCRRYGSFHSGVHTLNYIRSNYWIVKGRQTIKQLLKKFYL